MSATTSILNLPTEETLQAISNCLATMQGNVSGVKGNAETSYRTGQVNLTAENIGALPSNTTYVTSVNGSSGIITGLATAAALDEVRTIAEGSNAAISYANYAAMISDFNFAQSTDYKVGQSIYIVTLDVPDLWISSIEDISIVYAYTDDATFKSSLAANGYVQVGYFKLSALETEKVDISGLVNLTDIQTISGDKTFSSGINLGSGATITKDDSDRINLNFNSTSKMALGSSAILFKTRLDPDGNGTIDLGRDTSRWKDIYLSGVLSDGTNSVAVSNIIDKTTSQTISGEKKFNGNIEIGDYQVTTPAVRFQGANSGRSVKFQAENYKFKILGTSNTPLGFIDTSGSSESDWFFAFQKTIPTANNTYDLGSSTYKWKDLYLAGNLSDGTNTFTLSNIVTTSGAQTITGKKTITTDLEFDITSGGSSKLSIKNDNGYNAKIKMGSTENIRLMSNGTYFGATIGPINNNSTDLGSSSVKWRDLYLAGNLSDGTNTLSIANIINTSENQEITGIKSITDTSLDFVKSDVAGNAKWHLEEDQYAQLAISRTYNGTKQRMLQFNGSSIVPEGSNSNLGSSSKLWQNIYVSDNLSDGTNSTTIANIVTCGILSNISGYDATKTQTLKNINGTFTWVND